MRLIFGPQLSGHWPLGYFYLYAAIYLTYFAMFVVFFFFVVVFLFFLVLFNFPVNNFSVILGRSHHFLGINQYFGNLKVSCSNDTTAVVGFEPWTSRPGVRSSTTEPKRLP